MIFQKEIRPQFRDAEANGLVGARGYFEYFQDVASEHMYTLGLGNDKLPDTFGMAWIYMRYRLHISREADFDAMLHADTWVEKIQSAGIMHQVMELTRNGEMCASGRVESCIYDMSKKRLRKLIDIQFPVEQAEDRNTVAGELRLWRFDTSDMTYRYTHQVRYSELDRIGHMTNLRYVSMLLNAFDKAFFDANRITDLEIHFTNQCFEGEKIKVFVQQLDDEYRLCALKEDGKQAASAVMAVEQRVVENCDNTYDDKS